MDPEGHGSKCCDCCCNWKKCCCGCCDIKTGAIVATITMAQVTLIGFNISLVYVFFGNLFHLFNLFGCVILGISIGVCLYGLAIENQYLLIPLMVNQIFYVVLCIINFVMFCLMLLPNDDGAFAVHVTTVLGLVWYSSLLVMTIYFFIVTVGAYKYLAQKNNGDPMVAPLINEDDGEAQSAGAYSNPLFGTENA